MTQEVWSTFHNTGCKLTSGSVKTMNREISAAPHPSFTEL